MSFNIADFTNINDFSEIAQSTSGRSVRSPRPSFFNAFLDQLPNTKKTFVSDARERSEERKRVLSHLLERLRAESEARRQELYSKLLQKDEEEKPYDIIGKCMDIARRIMRGENVSAEEMQFISRYFPELLFQALLLRQENTDNDADESLPTDDEDSKMSFEMAIEAHQ